MTQRNPIKVGLIGLGKMGQNHLRILSMLKSVELVFIYDLNIETAKHFSESYGIKTHIDLELLLPLADAVLICTPTVTHGQYIFKVGGYVKNIFVEKPLVKTLKEAILVSEFCDKNKINLQVGFIERFNPAVQSLKEVIDKSEKVISIDFTRTSKLSSRITDVDVISDLMIHDIDLAIYLNGPVKSIVAHGYSSDNLTDFASVLIMHFNDRFSRLEASRITNKKIRKISVTCLDMYIDCDLLKKEIIVNRQSKYEDDSGRPYTISSIQETIEVKNQEALLSELQAFVSSCSGEFTTGIPKLNDGVSSLKVCEEIQRSIT